MPLVIRPFVLRLLAVAGLVVVSSAMAQTPAAGASKINDDQLLSYLPKDTVPTGTVPWLTFRQVKLVEEKKDGKTTLKPEFAPSLRQLENKSVKLYGFVLPLSTTPKQKHFLLSPLPTHCPFCVSQGPDSMVEVMAKTPVEFNQWDPVIVTGKLELINDSSLFYRLVDAEPVKP